MSEDIASCTCITAGDFTVPSQFYSDNLLVDPESLMHLKIFILLRPLFIGTALGRVQFLTYEFYQSSASACHLGFDQLPIDMYLIDKLRAQQPPNLIAFLQL
jgi:hypothetical protein